MGPTKVNSRNESAVASGCCCCCCCHTHSLESPLEDLLAGRHYASCIVDTGKSYSSKCHTSWSHFHHKNYTLGTQIWRALGSWWGLDWGYSDVFCGASFLMNGSCLSQWMWMRCDADINNNRNHTKDAEYAKCASCFLLLF